MNKEQKNARVERYDRVLQEAGYAIITEFGKIPVVDVEQLRLDFEGVCCECMVLKNTLARIVFERQGYEEACEYLMGPSMLFFGSEEIAPAAKLIAKSAKKYPALKVKAIIYDEAVFPKEDFKSFTTLPTKNEVRSKLLSVIKAPQVQFVTVINAAQRVVGVFRNYADKRGD